MGIGGEENWRRLAAGEGETMKLRYTSGAVIEDATLVEYLCEYIGASGVYEKSHWTVESEPKEPSHD